MNLARRRFLFAGAALLAAPAIARADSLMPISSRILTPKLWGDGIHDDTYALQWLINKGLEAVGQPIVIPPGDYLISKTLDLCMPSGAIMHSDGAKLLAACHMDVAVRVTTTEPDGILRNVFISDLWIDTRGHEVEVCARFPEVKELTVGSVVVGDLHAPAVWPYGRIEV